jgi:hypothetical protein
MLITVEEEKLRELIGYQLGSKAEEFLMSEIKQAAAPEPKAMTDEEAWEEYAAQDGISKEWTIAKKMFIAGRNSTKKEAENG